MRAFQPSFRFSLAQTNAAAFVSSPPTEMKENREFSAAFDASKRLFRLHTLISLSKVQLLKPHVYVLTFSFPKSTQMIFPWPTSIPFTP